MWAAHVKEAAVKTRGSLVQIQSTRPSHVNRPGLIRPGLFCVEAKESCSKWCHRSCIFIKEGCCAGYEAYGQVQ